MKYRTKLESGQASLITAMILALVMGSIVLGMALVTSAGSQENVSSILSLQANYAAQSGVNDAIQAIKNGAIIPPSGSQNCSTFIDEMKVQKGNPNLNVLSTSPNTSYNCLLIQSTPANLQFDVGQAQSSVIHIDPTGVTGTNALTVSWPESTESPTNNVSDCLQSQDFVQSQGFVPPSLWDCPFPVLRMDLYEANPGETTTSSQALQSDTDSFLLVPTIDGTGMDPNVSFGGTGGPPTIVSALCSATTCQATLSFSTPFDNGYARLTSIYYDAGTVTISGDSGVNFQGSQLVIDSTGVDQDVLQRIQVRVGVSSTIGQAPNNAAEGTTSLCKQYILNGSGSSADPNLNMYPNTDGPDSDPLCGEALKPAIYLYPTRPEMVNVKLSYPTGFAQTIPNYNPLSGWNVLAQPSGNLTDIANGQNYPYLYWEGNLNVLNFNMSQGFVVAGKDAKSFLSHELPIIGLNQTETAAFLQYWLPKIDTNPYNLIHFAGNEYTDLAPLDIAPKPDSELRVFMAVEPISKPVSVTPQSFSPFYRHGFTVVEWGGTILSR